MPYLLAAALALLGFVAPATSTGVIAASAEPLGINQMSGPSVVEVPLESTLEVRPAAGWSFASCDSLMAASVLVSACSAEGFTVTGPQYDPSIDAARVPVVLRSGANELTVDYVIRLALPAPPEAPDTKVDVPLAAGAVSLVPLSDLSITCGLCTPGTAQIEVRKSNPSSKGAASVTGTHLVFAASRGARGPVEIDLRVTDDVGSRSKTFRVTLHLSAQSEKPFHGLHLVRSPGEVELKAVTLVFAEDPGDLILDSCGAPMQGAVRCAPGGSIFYTPAATDPSGETSGDQFSVRMVSTDGRQAISSVTFGGQGVPVAPGAGARRAKLDVSLPQPPPQEEDAAATGAVTGLSEIMNALGAS